MVEEKDTREETQDNGKIDIEGIIRVLAFVSSAILFVLDRLFHQFDPPIEVGVYALLLGIATGNEAVTKYIGKKK